MILSKRALTHIGTRPYVKGIRESDDILKAGLEVDASNTARRVEDEDEIESCVGAVLTRCRTVKEAGTYG